MSATTDFIQKYRYYSLTTTAGTGLFPSVQMAQAILESNSGKSGLAAKHNNLFGIKAGTTWKGPTINMATGEVLNGVSVTIKDNFRVYADPFTSFRDHVSFLQTRMPAALQAPTPADQARAIKAAGYATDPAYPEKLISLINTYNLTELDQIKKAMKTIDITIAVLVIAAALLFAFKIFKTV